MACEKQKFKYELAEQALAETLADKGSTKGEIMQAEKNAWNSKYAYDRCVAQSQSVQPVFDLNGRWSYGGTPGPFISVVLNSIMVDMSSYGRPNGYGTVLDSTDVRVTFPDDNTYEGKLVKAVQVGEVNPPEFIEWSNNTKWSKFYVEHVGKAATI